MEDAENKQGMVDESAENEETLSASVSNENADDVGDVDNADIAEETV